ncbi:MAG: CHASE2 domain-containing protein [Nostoc sp.]|uniref:CHASE2 domain-containing protein n=1 Tax=Nostoc sp. TaxID=1180 RepID=UPI002FF85C97
MREPVPDKVAQKFLKHFLEVFSAGQSIYAAVRTARQRLKGIEKEYPGASWLPVISEHHAVVPMTWAKPRIPNIRRLGTLLLLSLLITVSVLGVRHQGGLQTWELLLYDKFMRSRPQEKQDSRLLIVTVTEDDLDLPEQKQRSGSLSNLALARLLDKLAQYQAGTIGLDIYRPEPVQPNEASLTTRWKTDDNFFAICKVSDRTQNYPGVSPPKGVPPERQGFSDIVPDSDNVLRRHLLAMQPANPTSPCTARYALNAQLAFHYLEKKKGIFVKYTPQGDLQLGNIVFKRLRSRNGSKTESQMGSYQKVDIGGYQILLNYRSFQGSPLEIAPQVTLTDVLRGKVNPEQVKDRIVLIGTTAQSFRDYSPTPYMTEQGFSQEVPGVILQAQMVSQLVSAALDGRPLISVMPVWVEVLWIWSWSVVGGAIGYAVLQSITWRYRSRLYLLVTAAGVLGGLYILCLILFYQGIWVPLVPSTLVLVLTGSTVVIYLSTQQGQRQLISTT